MAEYIDREEAINAIAEDKIEMTPELIAISRAIGTYTAERVFDGINQTCDRHIESIKIIPAADVQPIVRCKDCKHFHLDYFGEVNGANIIVAHEICDLWAGGCKTVQNAFCSNGVRKDGEP